MQHSGIILAGGKSSRMGQEKGLMMFRGKPMIQHAIDAMSAVTDQIMIIANDRAYEQFGFPVYPDLFPDTGPLGGICTGLSHSKTEKNLVLSCDTPLVSGDLLSYIASYSEGSNLSVTTIHDEVHPLVAMYGKSLLPEFQAYVASSKLSLMKLLPDFDHSMINIHQELPFYHPHLLFNVNRPEQLQRAETLGLPGS